MGRFPPHRAPHLLEDSLLTLSLRRSHLYQRKALLQAPSYILLLTFLRLSNLFDYLLLRTLLFPKFHNHLQPRLLLLCQPLHQPPNSHLLWTLKCVQSLHELPKLVAASPIIPFTPVLLQLIASSGGIPLSEFDIRHNSPNHFPLLSRKPPLCPFAGPSPLIPKPLTPQVSSAGTNFVTSIILARKIACPLPMRYYVPSLPNTKADNLATQLKAGSQVFTVFTLSTMLLGVATTNGFTLRALQQTKREQSTNILYVLRYRLSTSLAYGEPSISPTRSMPQCGLWHSARFGVVVALAR